MLLCQQSFSHFDDDKFSIILMITSFQTLWWLGILLFLFQQSISHFNDGDDDDFLFQQSISHFNDGDDDDFYCFSVNNLSVIFDDA